jgi:Ni,Fe-hydrogenase III small subunit/ferredoxin
MFEVFKIWKHQGKQFIPDLTKPVLPESFLGRPEINSNPCKEGCTACKDICPTQAITLSPMMLDFGKCVLCNECTRACTEDKIHFTNDYKYATNERERLIVKEGESKPITLNEALVRKEIRSFFGRSLKLRQVSAAGENSCEWELGATGNPNFDFGRFGIDFVASPRHSDGLVITGPISENMAEALQICYDAVPAPKIIILVGVDAISGGIFAGSNALNREFLNKYKVDLYVPGNPPHPLTFINGVMEMIKLKKGLF